MRITAIEAFPIRLGRESNNHRDFVWARDYPAVNSPHIEAAMVKVSTDKGLFGWGECDAPVAPEIVCTIIDKLLAPILIGAEFDSSRKAIDGIWNRMYSTMRVRGHNGGFLFDAMSGIDIAIWDIAGKALVKPISALIADTPAKTHVEAYLSGLTGSTNPDRVAYAQRFHSLGFRKFKVYYGNDWKQLLFLIDDLKQLSPDTEVAVDALWHLEPARAEELLKELEPRKALWLESPLLPEYPASHRVISIKTESPIAIGESYHSCQELMPFFEKKAIKIVQPDVGRSGISESVRIAKLAADNKATVVPNVGFSMGPQLAASIHLAAATPNCSLLEFSPRVLEQANKVLRPGIRMERNTYQVPLGPGLGAMIDEANIRALAAH